MSKDTKQVIVYATSWCGFCRMVEKYLHDKGIEFVVKDIEKDEEARAELMGKIDNNFRGVPVTDVGGSIVLGFDRPSIDAALSGDMK